MNGAGFTEIDMQKVLDLLQTACIIAGVAILTNRLAAAKSDIEREAIAQALLKIIGMVGSSRSRVTREMEDDGYYEDQFSFR